MGACCGHSLVAVAQRPVRQTDGIPGVTALGIGLPDLCCPLALTGARLAQTLVAYCTTLCAETREYKSTLPPVASRQ
jgi:hypothetical protein